MKFHFFCYLVIVISLFSCQTEGDIVKSVSPDVNWGNVKSAYLNMPISVSISSIEKKVNASIPWKFNNAAWPGFDDRGVAEPQIKYTVTRDSIQLKPEGNTLYFDMNLSYGIEGNYCPLTYSGECKAPRIPFSCGVGNEAPRKMHWVGKIIWSIGADFKLSTRSETIVLKANDPCQFTFLKVDFTKMVQQEFEKAIANALQAGDQQMSKINLLKSYDQVLINLNKGLDLKGNGFLGIYPQKVTMSPVVLKNNRMVTWVGVETQMKWSNSPLNNTSKQPTFQYIKNPEKSPWVIDFDLSWEAIESLVQSQWLEKKIILKNENEFIQFKSLAVSMGAKERIKISGLVDIQTEKLKRKKVNFELSIKPVLVQGGKILLEEFDIDLGFKNKLIETGIAIELMQKRWKDEGYNVLDIQPVLSDVVLKVNEKIKQIPINELNLSGGFDKADIQKMLTDLDGLKMTLALTGQWEMQVKP